MSRIVEATNQISREFCSTPQYCNDALSELLGCEITLKVETCNPIRCFKGRGADIAITRAIDAGVRSVVCASAGNLGQAVAYCATRHHVAATVFASHKASPMKLERISSLGAQLKLVEGDIETARSQAQQYAETNSCFLIEDSENIGTCEGAATIGVELISTELSFDCVLLALGGGALATGVGYVFKQRSPQTQVVTVQPKGAPAMTLSWRSKTVVCTEDIKTIADGVAGRFPIKEVLEDLLEIADDAILVSESSIRQAMRVLYTHAGLVVEPSAALGVAAILEDKSRFAGKKIASVICGSNVEPSQFQRWVMQQSPKTELESDT